MLFRQVKNHNEPSQSQKNRKIREDFHKKIRKQALNKKISSMRKSLLIDPIYDEKDTQTMKLQEQFLSHFDEYNRKKIQQKQTIDFDKNDNMYTIVKSLSLLSKFYKMKLKNTSEGEMKRFMKKIDAIICLLMNIDGWILQDRARTDIDQQIKMERAIEIDYEDKNINNVNSQNFDNLKPLKWIPQQTNKSKLQLLRELIMIVLFEKISNCLQMMKQITYIDGTIISSMLIKWLFFYEANMKIFYMNSNLLFKQTLEQQGYNYFQQTITSYYFEVVFMIIKFMKLEQISEFFFNSFKEINCFNFFQQSFKDQLINMYITSSPFQYLIENRQYSQKFLEQVQKQMKAKIQQKDKLLCIQKLKSLSLNQQENLHLINQLTNEEIELQRSKAILSTLSKKLQCYKKKNQIKYDFQQ